MSASLLWLLVPTAPLLLLLVALVRRRERLLPWLWLGCVPALWASFWPPSAGLDLPWLGYDVHWGRSDGLSLAWLGFSATLWGCATLFAASSQQNDPHRWRFWSFWQLALSGNLMLIVAADALSFYFGFSLMSLAAYGLIVHRGGRGPQRAGRLYLQLAIMGEMALLAGIMLRTHGADKRFLFELWQGQPVDHLSVGLLLLGLGLKAGFWPLHSWLPLAHPAAPAPASAVLSGAMLKAGILGLWRMLPDDDPVLQAWGEPLLMVGLFGALYGVLRGLGAPQAKAVLAYSSVSQMGYFLMILALAWLHPSQQWALGGLLMLYGVHHGLAKGALFLSAGVTHGGRLSRGAWLLMGLPALALMGLPLSSGGAVKAELKALWGAGAYESWLPWLTLGSAGTALLLFRAWWLLYREAPPCSTPPPWQQRLPWALLCWLPIALPWAWPALRLPLFESLSPGYLWPLLWPLLAASLVAGAVINQQYRVPLWLAHGWAPLPWLSLRLKRLLLHPPLPHCSLVGDPQRWRRIERVCNRWGRADVVRRGAMLLVLGLWLTLWL